MNTNFFTLLMSVMLMLVFGIVGGVAYGAASVPPGDWDFCSPTNPCSSGQGDCDSNDDCKQGLTCTSDVGPTFGLAKGVDVCIGIEDQATSNSNSSGDSANNELYGGPTNSPTGGSSSSGSFLDTFYDSSPQTNPSSSNSEWTCPYFEGHHSYCAVCEADDANGDGTVGCDEGEGQCNNWTQCREGLICDPETHKCVKP